MNANAYPVGDDTVEIETPGNAFARGLADALRQKGIFEEVVPALRVVTVQFHPLMVSTDAALEIVRKAAADVEAAPEAAGPLITVPVRYGGEDGPDLDAVARSAHMSSADFIVLHTSTAYPVEMIGFTPGFAYLGGLDARVAIGRRETPRPRVPAGSVGVIRGFSGVYPLAGPGGWPIVGRTDKALFNQSAEEPFLLRPGSQVRFEAV